MSINAPQLVFSHLNLRFNPFGELSRLERAQVAVTDLGSLPMKILMPGTAVQIVGEHGRGKSSHLLALHAHMSQCAYTQIHTGDNPKFKKQDVQFVDSIENLGRFKRFCLYKRSRSIALTSHTDLSVELRNAGYTVLTRRIAQHCPERITAIFNRRIQLAQRDMREPVPLVSKKTVRGLIEEFGTDIRAIENQLYEIFQDLKVLKNV